MNSCKRCNGLMIPDRFSDMWEDFNGFRCINCGEVTDRQIAENRAKEEAGEKQGNGRKHWDRRFPHRVSHYKGKDNEKEILSQTTAV